HCFLLKCKEKLRHSLGRPSRSDFVQFEIVVFDTPALFATSAIVTFLSAINPSPQLLLSETKLFVSNLMPVYPILSN
ncbi:hypothetical protein, partial [Ruminococcus sp. 1001136sp1]